MRQICLDTETTGLDPASGHRVIEIGAVEMMNRTITGKVFHCYLNPEREIDRGATAVHGIHSDFLADKPFFKDVAAQFLEFVQDAELIIHNAPFDVGFINHELNLSAQIISSIEKVCKIFDTLTLARQLHPGQKNNLDALCKRYSVDNSDRNFHGALLDAKILAQVYLAMTGGQETMFEEVAPAIHVERVALAGGVVMDSMRVVMASDNELVEHEAYLEMLRKGKKEVVEW